MNQEEKLPSYLALDEVSSYAAKNDQDGLEVNEIESVIKSIGVFPITKEKLDSHLPSNWTSIDLPNPLTKSDNYVWDKYNFALCNGQNGYASYKIPITSTIYDSQNDDYTFCMAVLYASDNKRPLTVSLNEKKHKNINLICHEAQGIGFDVNTAGWRIYGEFKCNTSSKHKHFIELKLESATDGYWPHLCSILIIPMVGNDNSGNNIVRALNNKFSPININDLKVSLRMFVGCWILSLSDIDSVKQTFRLRMHIGVYRELTLQEKELLQQSKKDKDKENGVTFKPLLSTCIEPLYSTEIIEMFPIKYNTGKTWICVKDDINCFNNEYIIQELYRADILFSENLK